MTHELYEPDRYERELLAEIDRLRAELEDQVEANGRCRGWLNTSEARLAAVVRAGDIMAEATAADGAAVFDHERDEFLYWEDVRATVTGEQA